MENIFYSQKNKMLQKFPQKAIKKWNRFNTFEQGFIIYLLVLFICILGLNIIQINENILIQDPSNYSLLSPHFIKSGIIIIFSLILIILWNISFRFKRLLQILIGFKESDSLFNFILLIIISSAFLSIGDTTTLIGHRIASGIKLLPGYYIIAGLLIIGLIGNLLLAFNFSKSKKKSQLIKIIKSSSNEENNENGIKGLFE